MSRLTNILLWLLASLLILIAAAVIFILTFDWNRAKPWINERVSTAIGREFAIDGNLSLHWQRAGTDATPGAAPPGFWARWVPWPRLQAEDIRVGNPPTFSSAGQMATVRLVSFTLNPLPLLVHRISLPSLEVQAPSVSLLRNRQAVNNWTFASNNSAPSAWQLSLGRISLSQGKLALDDAVQKINIKADIDTLDPDKEKLYGLGWKLGGTFNGAPVSGQGKAGGVLSLQDQQQPYPLQAQVKVGKTSIGIQGTLTKPAELAALDLRLSVAGASMGNLYPLTGILLPETPPFATEGHLLGKIGESGSQWHYQDFSGKVGDSDLNGSLDYVTGGARPQLTGALTSNVLRFDDLAPLIGADSNAEKAQRGAEERQPGNKVLPVKTFSTEAWGALDADVRFTGKRIIRQKDLPITDLQAHLILKDKVLSLDPLNFGMAGGNLRSTIRLDGQAAQMKSELKLAARNLKIQKLYPQLDASRTSFGEINGDARLSATGNSVAAMLGSANGEVKTLVNKGAISKFLLEAAGLNVGNVVISKLFGDKEVKLNCLAGDLPVQDGVMQVKTLLLDTEDALIVVDGDIDMKRELLNLNVHPRSKGLRIISLRSPLYVKGSFKDPDVGVNKGVLALRAGGAVALGLLAPVTAILPLINVDGDQKADCDHLLEEVKKAPQAPPPGKSASDKVAPKK
ncbi:AraC family transcriptional regulator [Herbaspirillum frisingense GSF30]|uniref:AraC family transcriptional regulator n=1 Tax=Herbaspirillum frisingense GSF30 TaxID=864073 RepID=A0AAI9N3Q2_9BURK|nr:AsmA family protein [Herbaspirillum frisingense]EOA04716.1 AraC family transcriptional regulator [Herbaspirillum frisingense GSF30]